MIEPKRMSVFVSSGRGMVEEITQLEITGITTQSVYGRDIVERVFFDPEEV
jgi:hypothetical protein